MKPKGTILIIGGGEDKGDDETPDIASKNSDFKRFEILQELLPKNNGHGRIEVITTGSKKPEEVKKTYQKAFRKIGYANLGFMHIEDKMQARDAKNVARLEKAAAVFFGGGDQFRISTIMGGTAMACMLTDKYEGEKDFVVAGTSAGAMVMSKIMIAEGGTQEALLDSDLKTASGFGLLENCIVDTHFIKRGRFGRLAHAVMINPGQLGIGLGEDTALIIKDGDQAECRGSGMVVIIDGQDIGQTNITIAPERTPVFVENLRVHLLVEYCRFSIRNRQLANPAILPSKQRIR
jgi:cyanophycinase